MTTRRLTLRVARSIILSIVCCCSFGAAQGLRLEGTWLGTLEVQTMKLRIVFHLTALPNGGYRATMDSPDQGAAGIPVDTVVISSDSIRLILRKLMGRYDGVVERGDSSVAGTWSQAGSTFPLQLRRSGEVPAPRRPQDPKPPYPYSVEEVSVPNPEANVILAGTFTHPTGSQPVAAVVLITGSGPQNRDEMILGHRPFLVLADALTRRGVAVLRCDDRGVAKSTGNFGTAISEDFASDVQAMVRYLKIRPDVRTDRIGLIGHSEGGLIAPMVASRSKDVAFIVLMAGPSLTGAEIILLQSALIASAAGASPDAVRRSEDLNRRSFEIVRTTPDTSLARAKVEQFLLAESAKDGTEDEASRTRAHMAALQLTSPWMKYFLFYDPVPTLKKVTCPVLAIDGERDLQVPPDTNLQGIERALRSGGNADVTVRKLPGLNHLFQTAETGSPIEYGKIEETIAPAALQLIGDWVVAHAK